MHRHRLAERVVGRVPGAGEASDQPERLDDGLVRRAAAELEDVEQPDQAAAVVVGVGRLQRRLHRAPVQRPAGLELVHELAQRLLTARDRRKHDAADGAVRRCQRRLGDAEEDVLLAVHALERVDELLGDLLLRARPDPMHGRDQQVHERVGDLSLALAQQRRHQRKAQRLGMRPQMRRRLDGRPGAPADDDVGRVLPDLCSMTLDRAARPLVGADICGRDLQLPRDELDCGMGQLRAVGREPTVARVVLQQQREAKPRASVLRVDERPLVVEHRPVLDKLIQINRRSRGHGPSLSALAAHRNLPTRTMRRSAKWRLVTRFLPAPQVA